MRIPVSPSLLVPLCLGEPHLCLEMMIFTPASTRLVDLEYFLGSIKSRKDP